MKKRWKPLIVSIAGMLIIIQFVRPVKNISAAAIATNDISKVYYTPVNIQKLLQTGCYDCHSNNTAYPWYSNIQPIGLWLDNHIQEGKKEVNFSEFASYRIRKQYKKLEEIIDQVKEGEMPIASYTLIHRNAILTEDQKMSIANWAAAARDSIKATYPVDSLQRN